MYVALPWALSSEALTAFRAACGRLDLAPGPGGSRFSAPKETDAVLRPLLAPHFTNWTQVMVMALQPSAQIGAHRDAAISGTRTHIPLAVNPGCWAFHAGIWQQLTEGQAYGMDPTQLHGAVNWGATVRLSLVVDS